MRATLGCIWFAFVCSQQGMAAEYSCKELMTIVNAASQEASFQSSFIASQVWQETIVDVIKPNQDLSQRLATSAQNKMTDSFQNAAEKYPEVAKSKARADKALDKLLALTRCKL